MELRFRFLAVLVLATFAAACGNPEPSLDTEIPSEDPESEIDVVLPDESAEAQTILEFLNDGATTVELLDEQVALDVRAAENLVAHRDGADAVAGTSDDDLFESVEEVDAISYVGPAAIEKLTQFVAAQGWLYASGGNFEGVVFNTAQVTLALDLVNFADFTTLDVDAKLDSRAAENIVDARPIQSLKQLSEIAWVGTATLERLRAFLPTWQEQGVEIEVYDNVAFTHEEAARALAAANQATREQLNDAGITGMQDDILLNNRPYTSLSLVTSKAGIGPMTTLRLKIVAESHDFTSAAYVVNATDAAEFADTVRFALRDDEVFGGEIFALLEDGTNDTEWKDSVLSAIHDGIGERVSAFATAEVGRDYSSRDAAFFSVWTYGRGQLDAAKTAYPEGILQFTQKLSDESKLERGKKGLLRYWEEEFVYTEQWLDVFEGRTWAQVGTQVTAEIENFENNGEYFEIIQGYPNEYATAFTGRIYGLHNEFGVDHVGKVVIVYVEID